MLEASAKEFEEMFVQILDKIRTDEELLKSSPEAVERIAKIFEYNCKAECKNRGFFVAKSYCCILKEKVTREQLNLAYILGWLYQGIQTYVFIMDDAFDSDLERWKKPTWFATQNECFKITIIDGYLLQNMVYRLMDLYFSHLYVYPKLIEYIQEGEMDFFMGVGIENMQSFESDPGLECVTMEKYKERTTVTNLRVFYSGCFHLAMLLANETSQKLWDEVDEFCTKLVHYSVVKDDLHDSFDPKNELDNKPAHRDIKTGVKKFLLLKAKEVCPEEVLAKVSKCHGTEDDEQTRIVLNIYEEYKIPELVMEYMEQLQKELEHDVMEFKKSGNIFANLFKQAVKIFVKSKQF